MKQASNKKDDDELPHPVNFDAVKKYIVKKNLSISRKPEKRRLRQKWASRWTENPKGQSRQKLETYENDENDYPDRLKTHKGDLCKS